MVRHVGGQRGVGGLRGDLKDGRHGLKLRPWWSLSQHLHDGAADAPEDEITRVGGKKHIRGTEQDVWFIYCLRDAFFYLYSLKVFVVELDELWSHQMSAFLP